MIASRLAALALAATALAGCDRCGKKHAAPSPAESRPTRDVPGGPPRVAPLRQRPTQPAGQVRFNTALAPDEARALLPPFGGALGEPTVSSGGAQVRFPYCFDGASLDDAGQRAIATLRDAGWEHITPRAPTPGTTGVPFGIAAERDDLRLAVTIEAVGRPDCDVAQHKFHATASIARIAAPSGAPPP